MDAKALADAEGRITTLEGELDAMRASAVAGDAAANELEEAKGRIAVRAKREGSVVAIEVNANGPGIPEEAKPRLFEAFQSSSRDGGSGLGLAIAAELVRAHGGDIELVDEGNGTTFRLTVPDSVVELSSKRRSA